MAEITPGSSFKPYQPKATDDTKFKAEISKSIKMWPVIFHFSIN